MTDFGTSKEGTGVAVQSDDLRMGADEDQFVHHVISLIDTYYLASYSGRHPPAIAQRPGLARLTKSRAGQNAAKPDKLSRIGRPAEDRKTDGRGQGGA